MRNVKLTQLNGDSFMARSNVLIRNRFDRKVAYLVSLMGVVNHVVSTVFQVYTFNCPSEKNLYCSASR